MTSAARLLGFAFSNADFLFEIDKTGIVLFAAGAAGDLVREPETLVGKPANTLFAPSSQAPFQELTRSLRVGQRSALRSLTLATGAEANLAMFHLPENGPNISCTLARSGPNTLDSQTGIASREAFIAAAAKSGPSDALSLLDLPELPALCAKLPPREAETLLKRIGHHLMESGATSAGRISETSFGALSPLALGNLQLAKQVAQAFSDGGLPLPAMQETRIGLQGEGLSSEQRLLALRYVIDQFTEGSKLDLSRDDISAAFSAMIDKTQARLSAMTRRLAAGDFEIAYQPIKDLATGKISHYEALARFNSTEGTGETVKFIESLGVANAFDLAVADKVLSIIEQRSDVHIAFNVSGATMASPASFGILAGILAKRRSLAPRTLIEITETVGIQDLDNVSKAIAALRALGYRVGLDDFGAGAASINYLHAFQVDFVKFDGAMIRKIGNSPREDSLLAGLAKLCDELGVVTIAEWIENEAMAKAARAMGFHHGQGKWLGAPLLELPSAGMVNAKRKGVKESWG